MNYQDIHDYISSNFCINTYDKSFNIDNYTYSDNVKEKILTLKRILRTNNVTSRQIENIINDYILELIPSQVVSNIRNVNFKNIVCEYIEDVFRGNDYTHNVYNKVLFDSICDAPDYFITNNTTNMGIAIYIKTDLWKNQAQQSKGKTYVLDEDFHDYLAGYKIKVLNVICDRIDTPNKYIINLFNRGISSSRICYISNLEKIIKELMIDV